MDYVRSLQFSEKPDYNYLKDLFSKLLNKLEYICDYMYDWSLQKGENMPNNSNDNNLNLNKKSSFFNSMGISENLEKIKLG